jgi:hypothetical protein
MSLTGRVGRFFVLLGALLLAVFFASDLANAPRFNIFFWGFLSAIFGVLLWRRGRTPAEPSGRFRLIRTWRDREKDKGDGDKSEGGDED